MLKKENICWSYKGIIILKSKKKLSWGWRGFVSSFSKHRPQSKYYTFIYGWDKKCHTTQIKEYWNKKGGDKFIVGITPSNFCNILYPPLKKTSRIWNMVEKLLKSFENTKLRNRNKNIKLFLSEPFNKNTKQPRLAQPYY